MDASKTGVRGGNVQMVWSWAGADKVNANLVFTSINGMKKKKDIAWFYWTDFGIFNSNYCIYCDHRLFLWTLDFFCHCSFAFCWLILWTICINKIMKITHFTRNSLFFPCWMALFLWPAKKQEWFSWSHLYWHLWLYIWVRETMPIH